MSLLVMTFVGFLVLALGCMLFWLTPMRTSQPKSIKPIGTSALSHRGSVSANRSESRMDGPDSAGARQEMDVQRR